MKKNLLIICLIVTVSAFGQRSSNVSSNELNAFGFPKIPQSNLRVEQVSQTITPIDLGFDTLRALTEINDSSAANAYPWISGDGLRLYYIHGTSFNYLNFTSRTSTGSLFRKPVTLPLPISTTTGIRSFWLSENELDIYLFNDSVYHAQRTSVGDNFGNPTTLQLTQNISSVTGYFNGTLNQSQNVLFVSNYDNNYIHVYEFHLTSANSFTYVRTLQVPNGYTNSLAQLSKDDLTIFLDISTAAVGAHDIICQMNRASINDTFAIETFKKLDFVNDSIYFDEQTSLSDNNNSMVFVRNAIDSWVADRLFIAFKKSSLVTEYISNKLSYESVIYPNPSTGWVTVSFSTPGTLYGEVFNSLGEKLSDFSGVDTSVPFRIDLSNKPKGTYFIRTIYNSSNSSLNKVIVE